MYEMGGGLEVRNSNSLGLFIRKAKKTLVLSNINRNFATYKSNQK